MGNIKQKFPKWPSHVWIVVVIAFLTLLVNGVSTYLQWKQVQTVVSAAPNPAKPLQGTPAAAPSPSNRGKQEAVTVLPFVLTSLSSLTLFLLLLLAARQYSQALVAGKKHREYVEETFGQQVEINKLHGKTTDLLSERIEEL